MRYAGRPTLVLALLSGLAIIPPAAGQGREWPWLGVIITDIGSGAPLGYEGGSGGGAYVTGVEQPGPASAAGLHSHDIIIAVDGLAAVNTRELTCLIQGKRPGDIVSVTIMRGGRQKSVPTTLGRWPEGKDFPRPAVANCGRDPVSGLRGKPAARLPAYDQRATA
jgi:hypothetical protein